MKIIHQIRIEGKAVTNGSMTAQTGAVCSSGTVLNVTLFCGFLQISLAGAVFYWQINKCCSKISSDSGSGGTPGG